MSYHTVYQGGMSSSPSSYVVSQNSYESTPLENIVSSSSIYSPKPEMNHMSANTSIYSASNSHSNLGSSGIYSGHLNGSNSGNNNGIYQTNASNTDSGRNQKSILYKLTNYSIEHVSKEPQIFKPVTFVNPDAPKTKFIKASEEVMELVEEVFEKTTGNKLPNFNIMVCEQDEFVREHNKRGGKWSQGIVGFAVHTENRIFVVENNLVELLLTIGHEIGHLMSEPLSNIIDEEAKAFAFSRAFAETIHREDIGGLGKNIRLTNPASNGIHDVADNFVIKLMEIGRSALEVFNALISRSVSIVE